MLSIRQRTYAFLIYLQRRFVVRLQLVIFIANIDPLVFHDVLHTAEQCKHSVC